MSAAEARHRELLRSIVEVARAIFRARAASIFLLDEEREELVFEAVAGEGEGTLVGRRFSASTGVAGWVLVTRQPLVVDDLEGDPRFSLAAAESTGYVPEALMAVPLLADDRALGVLEVLDRSRDVRFALADVDLLALFAHQAAIALDLLRRLRGGDAATAADADLRRLADALEWAPAEQREGALAVVDALARLLRT